MTLLFLFVSLLGRVRKKDIFQMIVENQPVRLRGVRGVKGTASVWSDLHIRFQLNIRCRFRNLTQDDGIADFCAMRKNGVNDPQKIFYESLEPVPVVIPYAKDIAEFINRRGSLPIASRRAFKRVLATIKTIALIHQKQRRRDDMGRVVADYSDYFIAYQLVGDSFRESLGEGQRYTDNRMRLIEEFGAITPRALSEKTGVSTAAISQWLKPLIEKGVLFWCDEKGNGFMGVVDLEKAKRSGKAFVRVAERPCLPSPYQLTGDSMWDVSGEYWKFYDLEFEGTDGYEDESTVMSEMETEESIDEKSVPLDVDGAVKVLSEKTGADNNFQNESLDSGLVPAGIDNWRMNSVTCCR